MQGDFATFHKLIRRSEKKKENRKEEEVWDWSDEIQINWSGKRFQENWKWPNIKKKKKTTQHKRSAANMNAVEQQQHQWISERRIEEEQSK